MGKVVKGVAKGAGKVLGVVPAFITGGKDAALDSLLLTGAAILNPELVLPLVASTVIGEVSKQFKKKPNQDLSQASDALQRLNLSINPDAPCKFVFGTTAAGTDIVYAEKIDDDKIVYIVEIAGHKISAINAFHIDDTQISFSGNAATGDYANILWRYDNLGTDSQTYLTGFGAAWPSTARGRGRAHIAIVWDVKKGREKLGMEVPTRVTVDVDGALCYDPRLDTTVGGSGSHRADDPSTWEFSKNWELVTLTFLLGLQTNSTVVIGKGESPNDIDYDNAIEMANVCDETVDSKPRYRVGGIWSVTGDDDVFLQQMEAAIGGRVARVGGKWYTWVPHDDITSEGTITESSMVRDVGVYFDPGGDVQDLKNTGRGRYVSPDLLYQTDFYPEVTESSAVTEDGGARVLQADYAFIQDVEIAERVTRFKVRRSRFAGTWAFGMTFEALQWKPFDVVTLNCTETNDTNQLVRILDMTTDGLSGIVALTVIEEDTSIYDDTVALGTPVTQLDPMTWDPTAKISVSGLAAADTAVTGDGGTSKNFLLVSWTDPGGFVERTEVQYRVKTGPGTTQDATPKLLDFTQVLVGPVEQSTVYEVRARHISRFGVIGDWSSWVEETSGASETVAAASGAPWSGVTDDDGNRPEDNATSNTNTDNLIRNPGAEDGVLLPHVAVNSGGAWSANGTGRGTSGKAFEYNVSGQTSDSVLDLNGAADDPTTGISAGEGTQVWGRAYIRGATGSAPWNRMRLEINWRDGLGNSLSVTPGAYVSPSTSWQKITVDGGAPAGAVYCRPRVRVENSGNAGNVKVDDILFNQKLDTPGLVDNAVTSTDVEDDTTGWTNPGTGVTGGYADIKTNNVDIAGVGFVKIVVSLEFRFFYAGGGTQSCVVDLRMKRDSTIIGSPSGGYLNAIAAEPVDVYNGTFTKIYYDSPAAGNYDYTIQANSIGDSDFFIQRAVVDVVEMKK